MRKGFATLMLLLFALLALGACSNSGQNVNLGKTASFIGGTEGLRIEFEQDSPPEEVFDNGELPFDVVLKVSNMGEADIAVDDVEIRLSGIRAEEFGVTEADLIQNPLDDLLGAYKDSEGTKIDGIIDYVTFTGLNYQNSLAGNQQFTLRADACYKYKTEAVSKICITRDILDTTYDKVCVVNEPKAVQNSGAPIQISNFRESPRGREKVQFSFDVIHSSGGDVFKADSNCAFTTENERVVHLSVNTNLPGLKCTGWRETSETSGHVTLFGGSPRTVTCSQEAQTSSDFEQVVNVEAEYDYLISTQKPLLVKHAID